jgi:uncharacterized protein (TIGR00251 family)
LQIKVKPNARESLLIEPGEDNIWSARLKSPPVDGKANQELIALIAGHFGCKRNRVLIKSGSGARIKLVQILDD